MRLIWVALNPRRRSPSALMPRGTAGRPAAVTYAGDILGHGGKDTSQGVGANAAILVNRSEPPEHRPVTDMYVSGQCRVVGEHGMVPDCAVVCDMDICHDPVVVAHAGLAGVLHGTPIDGAVFANRIAVSDVQLRGFAGVLLVLRIVADGCELKDVVVLADDAGPLQHHVGLDSRAPADLHIRSDNAVWTDRHVRVKTCTCRNHGARVDHP